MESTPHNPFVEHLEPPASPRNQPEPQAPAEPPISKEAQTGRHLGLGLDVGTVNLVCAEEGSDSTLTIRAQRNAFIDVKSDPYTKNMLTKLGVHYVVSHDSVTVLGDPSFELAGIFNRELRRPMRNGFISPNESDALPMIKLLVEGIVGPPQTPGEVCYFSIPAEPIDAEMNVIYHKGIFESVLRRLGYTPRAMLEGHAVVFSELADQDFTGIGISCGGGMFNICVSYKTVPVLSFSISRGGDWIDTNVATVLGTTASRIARIKENGVNLIDSASREEEAIAIYYRHLIDYLLEHIARQFHQRDGLPGFPEPVDIVCSGGTALPEGFLQIFQEQFQPDTFPIPIRRIRLSDDPLNAVAKGCLVAAISEK